MEYINLIFPLNIGQLTYKCPEHLREKLKLGVIINAPLKNRIIKGVFSEFAKETTLEDIKTIYDIFTPEPVLSPNMLNLLKWSSDYYFAEQGIILKHILPKEFFNPVKTNKKKPYKNNRISLKVEDLLSIKQDNLQLVLDMIEKKTFRTFLLHAPSLIYEYSFLLNLIRPLKNIIILAPDVNTIEFIYPLLKSIFGERLAAYHGKMSKGCRSNIIKKIISGEHDIIIGTRSVVFSPMKTVSLLVVLQEHSQLYKQECHPYYNARDVAVKRGFFENATVLLSSISPSTESIYNCKKGKYTLINQTKDTKHIKIKLTNLSTELLIKPNLSKSILESAKIHMKKGDNIFFILNRKGYSTTLQCIECNNITICPTCKIPLVYYKNEKILRCNYCGHVVSKIPEVCPICKGFKLKFTGGGTQRLQEDIETLLNIKTIRIDKECLKKKREIERFKSIMFSEDIRFIIGTKLIINELPLFNNFKMGSFLNPDKSLNKPDFRAAERLYQEISLMKEYIKDGGELYIQTRIPNHYLYKSIKENNYNHFLKEELLRRKTLNYPPFSKLALIKITTKDSNFKMPDYKMEEDVNVLGPSLFRTIKNKNEYRLLIKSTSHKKLTTAIKQLSEIFREIKTIDIKIDIDPIIF